MLFCSTSGRTIVKHHLADAIHGRKRTLVADWDAQLYKDYVLVKYGVKYRLTANLGNTDAEPMVTQRRLV